MKAQISLSLHTSEVDNFVSWLNDQLSDSIVVRDAIDDMATVIGRTYRFNLNLTPNSEGLHVMVIKSTSENIAMIKMCHSDREVTAQKSAGNVLDIMDTHPELLKDYKKAILSDPDMVALIVAQRPNFLAELKSL